MDDNTPETQDEPHIDTDAPEVEYKLAEVRGDGTGVIRLPDGRMFLATIKEGLAVRKNAKVDLDFSESDKDGVPLNATVTGLSS